MAPAAQYTSRIRLGTLAAIPSNRIAPVTASAIDKLAPGRVIWDWERAIRGAIPWACPQYRSTR